MGYPLARRLGLFVLEVDDLVTAIKAVTTPDQLPVLHHRDTHPKVHRWSVGHIDELTKSVIGTLQPAIDAVICDHLDFGTKVVIEGDYLRPSLAVGRAAVRGMILHEPDVEQLVRNFALREPDVPDQRTRAEVSAMLNARLAGEATALGVPVVAARPWSTALDRTAAALGLSLQP